MNSMQESTVNFFLWLSSRVATLVLRVCILLPISAKAKAILDSNY